MFRKVIMAGLLGWIVLVIWTMVVNAMLGFRCRMDMREIAQEQQVYGLLKASLTEPGRYICNPPLTTEGMFRVNEPVFSIFYSGMGHEAAGAEQIRNAVSSLVAVLLAAWLLSLGSAALLASYGRKVLFFAALGVVIALFADLPSGGIGGYPLTDALIWAGHSIVVWTLIGLVVAWRLKPDKAPAKA